MQPTHPLYRFLNSFYQFLTKDPVIKSRPLRGMTGKFSGNLKEIRIVKSPEGVISGRVVFKDHTLEINVGHDKLVIGKTFPTVFDLSDRTGIFHYFNKLHHG